MHQTGPASSSSSSPVEQPEQAASAACVENLGQHGHQRARSASSRCATRWRSMPSMCAATAWSSMDRPCGVSTTCTLRRSFGQFCRCTRPASTMRSTRRVTPPVVRATSEAEPAHGEAALGSGPYVDQHVEEDQRDPDRLFELSSEGVGQAAMGTDYEAHELDSLVVDLSEDAAGALVGAERCPLLVTALRRDGRRSHLPASSQSPPNRPRSSNVSD